MIPDVTVKFAVCDVSVFLQPSTSLMSLSGLAGQYLCLYMLITICILYGCLCSP